HLDFAADFTRIARVHQAAPRIFESEASCARARHDDEVVALANHVEVERAFVDDYRKRRGAGLPQIGVDFLAAEIDLEAARIRELIDRELVFETIEGCVILSRHRRYLST